MPPPTGPARAIDTLLDGIALLVTDGRAAATPTLLRATSAFSEDEVPVDESLRWGPLATAAGNALWDDDGVRAVSARQIQIAHDAGALGQVPPNLLALGTAAARGGDFAAAASHMAEANAIVEATGTRLPPYTEMLVLAMRGHEAEAASLIERMIEQATDVRQGIAATTAHWAAAILYNGLGRYEDARAAAEAAISAPLDMFAAMWSLPELVESAARTEAADVARDAVERLTETTRAAGTDWGLGVEARSRALVSEGPVAEGLYREAIERLRRTKLRADLARSHLLYGEWLRREHRRVDARAQLRAAHDHFTSMGMDAFAERARTRALRHGREGPQADRRDARRADLAGAAHRAAGPRRAVEPGDRCAALPQPAHRRVAPAQGVHQARDPLAPRAVERARPRGRGGGFMSAHRVVIVGGGFGGLQATRGLRGAPVEITLIDRRNFHLFQPLSYQVATGALSPGEVAYPLRAVFKRDRNVRVLLAEVARFDLERREVVLRPVAGLPEPEPVPYDTLIVAGGSHYSYFGHDEWSAHAAEVKSSRAR